MTSSYGDRKGCTQKDEIAHKPHLMKKPTEPGERGGDGSKITNLETTSFMDGP